MIALELTLMFVLIIYKTGAFQITCPQPSGRYLRSKAVCVDNRNYTCLFNENRNSFSESCSVKFDFQRPGYRVTLRTNLHAEPCPDNLYQPFIFFTNKSSNCELKRSLCSNEGQVISSSGTIRTDRHCRCNYANGYAYVNLPRNICSCIPSVEDCSCYRKICSKNHILSPDYQCIDQFSWSGKFVCSSITDLWLPKRTDSSYGIHTREAKSDVLKRRQRIELLVIIIITTFLLLTSFLFVTATFSTRGECCYRGDNKYIYDCETLHLKKYSRTGFSIGICCNHDDTQHWQNCATIRWNEYPKAGFSKGICCNHDDTQYDQNFAPARLNEYSKREADLIEPIITNLSNNVNGDMIEFQLESRADVEVEMKGENKETLKENGFITQFREIEEWENEIESFIETDVITQIKEQLASKKCIVMWGQPGSGKTISLHYLALFLQSHFGYKPVHCLEPSDVLNHRNETGKRTLVFDDMCGRFVFSHEKYLMWKSSQEIIESMLQTDDVKLLMTVSSAAFMTDTTHKITVFSDYAFELTVPTILPSDIHTVVKDLKQSSVRTSLIKYNEDSKVPLPKIKFGASLPLRDAFEYFTGSSEYITNKVEYLRESNRAAFCSLFICILKKGYVDEAILTSDDNCLFTNSFMEVCKTLDIVISRRQFLDNLYFLMDVFISKENGSFVIKQANIYEVLAIYFGEKLQRTFISFAEPEIITQHCDLQTCKTSVSKATFSIEVNEENEDLYFQRINEQLLNKNICEVFSVRQMSSLLYRQKLADFLRKQDPASVKQISLSKCKFDNQTTASLIVRYGYVNLLKLFFDYNEDLKPDNCDYLEAACKTDNLPFVDLLISMQVNINKRIADGCTALHIASKYGFLGLINYLIKHNAEVNCTDMHGNTPLIEACKNENEAVISFLLEHGANIKQSNFEKQCPLMIAIRNGRMRIVDLLISYHGDVNCTDIHGNTPLIEACKKENESIVSLLLTNGANINKSNSEGQFPLLIAARKGRTPLVDLLISNHGDVNKIDCSGFTCLMHSIQSESRNLETILALLNACADVNCSSADGTTSLIIAVQNQARDVVNLLTDYVPGANFFRQADSLRNKTVAKIINKCDNRGISPLMYACKIRNKECDVVKDLISKGADINCIDYNNRTPLIVALKNEDDDLVRYLVEQGASLNLPGDTKTTPLHEMCKCGQLDNVRLLISKGCVIDIVDKNGMTPLMIASKYGYFEITKFLIEENAKIDAVDYNETTALMLACMGGFGDIIRVLVKRVADINKKDKNNWTALLSYVNSKYDHADIVLLLIDKGADVNSSTKDGVSSLMIASFRGHQEIVKCLLHQKINVNHKDIYGKTPIFSACLGGDVDIMRLLIANGASTRVIDKNGDTLESIARKNKLFEVVDFFTTHSA